MLFGLPIDPNQVKRIEATHRGFLYQHLFGAACLLCMSRSEAKVLITESDEDVELIWPDKRIYVQIKTRNHPLQWNDIKEAIERFDSLRNEHTGGQRSGVPQFIVVTNTELGPELKATIQDALWYRDIVIQTPQTNKPHNDIPPAWSDLVQALEWCSNNAKEIPLLGVQPETLTWKLASRIQYAATGHGGHKITADELPSLFEQLVIQLQHFPEAPGDYRPQMDEPPIQSEKKIRFIVGVSGAGKTAWASQSVLHSSELWAYFDVSNLPQSALASSLARELVAQFLGSRTTGIVATILSAKSGLEMLQLASSHFGNEDKLVNVVLDNAHLLSFEAIKTIAKAATHIKFLLLAQPWPEQNLIETAFNVKAEELKGWSMDSIALEFADAKCPADVETIKRILSLTLGLPLFVQNAIQIAIASYGGDVKAFCNEIENRQQAKDTAQDLILRKIFQQLSEKSRQLAGLLSLSDVPLERMEIDSICEKKIGGKNHMAASLRELSRYGIIKFSLNGDIKLHDIFKGLAKDQLLENSPEDIVRAKLGLAKALEQSMPSGLGRFGLWLRLLAETDQIDVLVDLATIEWFHEIGDPKELKAVLEDASGSSALSAEERFWALDALTFWDTQDHLYENIPIRVKDMEALSKKFELSSRAKTAIAMKQMVQAGFTGNQKGIETSFKQALKLVTENETIKRIIRYNRAYAYFYAGNYFEARDEIEALIVDYYEHLNLELKDVIFRNPDYIIPLVSVIPTWKDDMKHLADCLDLLSGIKRQSGEEIRLEQLHALKFYAMSEAYNSAIRVGQNAVDQLVKIGAHGDARKTIETALLPMVKLGGLIRYEIQVRSQYALVLAYCGDTKAAQNEMEKLKAYEVSLAQKYELQKQASIIERVASGELKIKPNVPSPTIPDSPQKKIGRNDPCPCGSGIKYKKCHGS